MSDATQPRPAGTGMLCPVCRVDLVMSERQGIEIDYCPRCRGVWLDRGELDKIIERSTAEPPAAPSFSGGVAQQTGSFLPPQPPPQFYPDPRGQGPWQNQGDRHHDDDDHRGRGRGSFLSRLFD
jgi:Zn-finger nucleic acid-binding protein